ncbi:hypothetical protein IAD21_00522 [Abditibacteriota bacterium]|nr:hypothetical protein IAD21_00522 [Abditibacteriota bacterium]
MRLLIFSMPAVALAAIFSVSVQRSMSHMSDSPATEVALPEASRIFWRQTTLKQRQAMAHSFMPLSPAPNSRGWGSDSSYKPVPTSIDSDWP